MKVIKDDAGFNECASGLINSSVGWVNISHTQDVVLTEAFLPYLGEEICTWLSGLTGIEADASKAEYWLQRSMARLMLSSYIKTLVEITPSGSVQTTTDKKSPAYKYKEFQFMSSTLRQGYNFLEKGIQILESEEDAIWLASEERQSLMRWVPWASTMSRISGKQVSRWDYERIVPAMDDISITVISKIIPEESRELIMGDYLKGELEGKLLELIKIIQRAVVHLGISEAVARGWVQLNGGMLVATELTGDAAIESMKSPSGDAVSLKLRSHNMWGSEYVNSIIKFILVNKEEADFEPIATYYRSNFPETTSDPECAYDNQGKGIFRL